MMLESAEKTEIHNEATKLTDTNEEECLLD
jgi:hypothetical protein